MQKNKTRTGEVKLLPVRFAISPHSLNSSIADLHCPVCGCHELHIGEVTVDQGNLSVSSFSDRCETKATDRHLNHYGSRVILRLWCEWGHVVAYVLSFHKGTTTIELRHSDFDSDNEFPSELWRD